MNIAVILEHPNSDAYSGGRYHGWFVACGLFELGHHIDVITQRLPPFFDTLRDDYLVPEVHQHHIHRPDLDITEGGDYQYDLVVGYPILASEWALNAARKVGVPCYNWILDCESLCKKYAPAVGNRMHYGPSHTKALRDSDKLLSISNYAVPFIKEWTGNQNTVGLMGCVNSRLAASVQTEKTDRLVAITRRTEHKRFDDLCYVAKKLGIHIDVITSFGARQIEDRIAAKGANRWLRVWDSPDDRLKFHLIKQALALLCPSAYEGLGLPMMEALYCGVPVLCYDYGVMREVCEDAALYASWSSPESLTRNVFKFLDDEFLRQDLEMAARRIGPRYSFGAMCKRLKDVFGTGDHWDMTKREVVKEW